MRDIRVEPRRWRLHGPAMEVAAKSRELLWEPIPARLAILRQGLSRHVEDFKDVAGRQIAEPSLPLGGVPVLLRWISAEDKISLYLEAPPLTFSLKRGTLWLVVYLPGSDNVLVSAPVKITCDSPSALPPLICLRLPVAPVVELNDE